MMSSVNEERTQPPVGKPLNPKNQTTPQPKSTIRNEPEMNQVNTCIFKSQKDIKVGI